MSHIDSVDSACRNTNSRARAWTFTWNNYVKEDIDSLTQLFSNNKYEYIFGEEIGEQKTPHLQGCFRAPNQIYFNSVKTMLPKCHIEQCKNWNASKIYCSKDGKTHSNLNIKPKNNIKLKLDSYMQKKYKDTIWKPWQQNILNIINKEPDERTIHWIWEPEGNVGKTFLAKYILWKYKALIVNGKQTDIFHGIKNYLEEKEDYMDIIVIDIPRTNENYVCYGTMEKIKDGIFYSGKYEGGQILLTPCHVIIFANFKPELHMMSKDRWNIIRV